MSNGQYIMDGRTTLRRDIGILYRDEIRLWALLESISCWLARDIDRSPCIVQGRHKNPEMISGTFGDSGLSEPDLNAGFVDAKGRLSKVRWLWGLALGWEPKARLRPRPHPSWHRLLSGRGFKRPGSEWFRTDKPRLRGSFKGVLVRD